LAASVAASALESAAEAPESPHGHGQHVAHGQHWVPQLISENLPAAFGEAILRLSVNT